MLHSTSCTKGHRERYLLGKTPLPAKKLLCCTSAYYHKRTERGKRADKVSQGMKGELAGTEGTAEGRETMEVQVRKGSKTIMWEKGQKHQEQEKRREKQKEQRERKRREGVRTTCS